MNTARRRVTENPFYVLGLSPDASRAAIELEAQKLLAMFEIGFAGIESYATPLGAMRRTADDVRRAVAELRDPDKRLAWELWACLAPGERLPVVEPPAAGPAPWPDALAALGWGAKFAGGGR